MKNFKEFFAVHDPVRFLIILGAVLLTAFAISLWAPDFFLIPFIPALFLIVYIFITKRIHESLVIASLLCFVFADGPGFFNSFADGLTEVMMSQDIAWLLIVCGLMGSIILLIEKAGGTFAFGNFVAKHCKSRKGTLMWTWTLGAVIFVDDYLNSLTVGACMSNVTDRHKCSRELLAYVVDSTAAPICVLIPISTWAVFASRILAANGVCTVENSLAYFIRTIPFNFYAWFAAILVIFVIMGWFPYIGKMKKAEERVRKGGPLSPPNSEKVDVHGNDEFLIPNNPKMMNFLLPMGVLVASTLYFDVDMGKGVLFTLGFMFVFYIGQGLMTPDEFIDYCIEGLKNMLLPCLLMILAFLFSMGADKIGFTQSVIDAVIPFMTPQLMPAIIFVVLGITEFITGTNWGLYIIALPIVIPLSQQIGGNTLLAVSAVLSAGVFGSHICFYSDATILSSAACGCNNFDHAASQVPYGLVAAAFAFLAFLITGFLIG